jgi:hypothetical protein
LYLKKKISPRATTFITIYKKQWGETHFVYRLSCATVSIRYDYDRSESLYATVQSKCSSRLENQLLNWHHYFLLVFSQAIFNPFNIVLDSSRFWDFCHIWSLFFILYSFMTSESWGRLFVISSYIVMSVLIVTNTTDNLLFTSLHSVNKI